MVKEICIIKIDPSKAADFEKMYVGVAPVLRRQSGYLADELLHAIERPEEYMLVVHWDEVKSHQAFIDSDDYPLMSGEFGKFVLDSSFAHYQIAVQS